jgi:ATP phosphoribosyltransferase regulatory subunit
MTRPARSPIPQGVATFLPVEAGEKRAVEDVVFSVFREHGYREVIPPTFEYLDILAPGLDAELIEKSYKVVDRATGRILVMRPDVTAQIARMVAMGMVNQPLPLRLCYSVNVFRYEPEHAGRDREIFQIGLELIGPKGTSADVEPIMVAAECLRRLGVTSFKIAIGQGAFFNALLGRTGVAESVQRSLREAAARKDVPKMEALLHQAGVRGRAAKALLAVPELYGGAEVLEEAARLAPPTEDCRRPLARLREVWEQMTAAGLGGAILLDMGEIRRMEYYTGLVFDIYVDRVGAEVGGGGRYDHLIGRFGREVPSTGFAFDLDRLLQLRSAQGGRARATEVRGRDVAARPRRATRGGRR